MPKQEKYADYTLRIMTALQDGLFSNESPNQITMDELSEDDNATHFIHALATCAPAILLKRITGNEMTMLEFNHVANTLVMQFGTIDKD